MANTKEVFIEALVPYDWASNLTTREAKVFAAYCLGCTGLAVEDLGTSHTVPVPETGGCVTMHRVRVYGVEAVPPVVLSIMRNALERQRHAELTEANYTDLDDQGYHYSVPTLREYNNMKRRMDRRFAKRNITFGKPRVVNG